MTSQFRIGVPFITFPIENRKEHKISSMEDSGILVNNYIEQVYIYSSLLNKYEPYKPPEAKQKNKYYRIV